MYYSVHVHIEGQSLHYRAHKHLEKRFMHQILSPFHFKCHHMHSLSVVTPGYTDILLT